MLRGEYALFERYSTKNCYHHHAQNSKYSSPHFSGNERQAEIDLWQVQRGMVVQLQEEGLPLCWQCEFCQYFANIKSIIKVILVIQVAKYNKLYLCGSSMPSDFKLTSKVTWIIQNTKLRYESSTLILYLYYMYYIIHIYLFIRSWLALTFKCEWVSQACVTPFQISTFCNI